MKKCSYCGRDNADEALNCPGCGTEFEREVLDSEAINGGQKDEEKTLTIRIFSSYDDAGLAAAKLEAYGIKCWVNADDCSGWYTNLTVAAGVRLQVRAEDAEVAVALLDAKPSPAEIKQIEIEAVLATPPKTDPIKKLAWEQIFVGICLGIIICLLYHWKSEPVTITHYHYTANGKRDEGWIYRNGQLIEYLADRNLDGKWDHWTYYEHGRAVRSENDNNFDGKADEFWTFSDEGRDTLQKDTDFNGTPDEFCTYKYRIIQTEEMKPNGSKFATERELFRHGVLAEIWRGGDSNGNFSEVVQYDPFCNPISTNTPTAFLLTTPASQIALHKFSPPQPRSEGIVRRQMDSVVPHGTKSYCPPNQPLRSWLIPASLCDPPHLPICPRVTPS